MTIAVQSGEIVQQPFCQLIVLHGFSIDSNRVAALPVGIYLCTYTCQDGEFLIYQCSYVGRHFFLYQPSESVSSISQAASNGR